MIYLLIIIIILLTYIAFFTPEKIQHRKIKRVQKIFNTPLPDHPIFKIDDPRNQTHPEEMVKYNKNSIGTRELAMLFHEMEKKSKTKI